MHGTTRSCRPREFDLDPFRGAVCLWLMGLHFCWLSDAHAPLLRLVGPDVADALFHFRLGVESFLVLAGFMMAHMLRPVPGEGLRPWAYLARRGCQLLLPFAVTVILAAADKWAAYLMFGGGRNRPGALEIGSQLLLVNEYVGVLEAAVGYWTLATLEQFYVLWLAVFAAIGWFTSGNAEARSRRTASCMGPVALAVFLVSGAAFLGAGSLTDHLPRYAFYVAFGVLLYGYRCLGLYLWEFRTAVVGMIAATVWWEHSRLAAAVATAGVLATLAGGTRCPEGGVFAALRFIGRRSYSVYLIHAIVGMRVLGLSRFTAWSEDWPAIPFVLTAMLVSLAAGAVFNAVVERPCQDLARRVRYRVRRQASAASRAVQDVGGAGE